MRYTNTEKCLITVALILLTFVIGSAVIQLAPVMVAAATAFLATVIVGVTR